MIYKYCFHVHYKQVLSEFYKSVYTVYSDSISDSAIVTDHSVIAERTRALLLVIPLCRMLYDLINVRKIREWVCEKSVDSHDTQALVIN